MSFQSGHPVWRLRYWQRRRDPANARPRRGGPAFVAVEVQEPAHVVGSIAGVSIAQALSRVVARERLGIRFALEVVVGVVLLIYAVRSTRGRASAARREG